MLTIYKNLRKFFLSFIIVFVFTSVGFCDDVVTDSAISDSSLSFTDIPAGSNLTVVVDNSSLDSRLDSLSALVASGSAVSSSVSSDLPEMRLMSVNVSSERVSSSSANGFKKIVLNMIGDYETIITDYTYSNGSYTSHSIDITPDWSWILSCGVFALVLFCVFRLVGGILCSR